MVVFVSNRDGRVGIWASTVRRPTPRKLAAGIEAIPSPNGAHLLVRRGDAWVVMRSDGSRAMPLPGSPLAWSPDSRSVAMHDSDDLVVLGTDATTVLRIEDMNPLEASWSRDSRELAVGFDPETAGVYGATAAPSTAAPVIVEDGRRVTQPEWSPDGRRLVYVGGDEDATDVYVANADGTGAVRLTTTESSETGPTWSPDGKRIAFSSQRDGDWEIYVMDADGGSVRRVTHSPRVDTFPSWSPDGDRIAFQTSRFGNAEIMTIGVDGADPFRVTADDAANTQPDWSPDGSRVAYAAGGRIATIATEGGEPDLLTRGDASSDTNPAWSPSGNAVAFVRDGAIWTIEHGALARRYTGAVPAAGPAWLPSGELRFWIEHGGDIAGVDARTGARRRLTQTPDTESRPAWSPNGQALAYLVRARSESPWLLNLVVERGGVTRRIAAVESFNLAPTFAWSPNGAFLVYEHRSVLRRVKPDGRGSRRISARYVSGWSWAPNANRLAYTVLDDGDGELVALVDVMGNTRTVARSRRGVDYLEAAWSHDGRMVALVRRHRASASTDVGVYDLRTRATRWLTRTRRGVRNDAVSWAVR
jgi:TolB protein